ncbi:MAG TPA: tRNA uridine-5-carboxymethylaminomethyl(34) synthesis GTPase MnmE [Ruminococcus sp.]|nr:tRNA uridine-5-carboxymethylaminomethyl(34) synthesis GTPase MnmE [Ruminococcus sp.]
MKTIAAVSTPPAAGGIAMIRISGDEAIDIAARVFHPYHDTKITEMRGYTCVYGEVRQGDERLDDGILTVYRAPHSYTGEDVVEITCHGGIYLTKRVLRLLFEQGASPAEAGEFTRRAFMNGKLSLTQAESVMDIISADGAAALRQANLAREGILGKQMLEVSAGLIELLSAMTYWMDDAEEFPPELEPERVRKVIRGMHEKLSGLIENYENGRVLREGIRTVLLGLPNAGKSSVMNWLCGTDRSIVTEIAGTTRDIITEQVRVGDYTLLLSDTAGIRETENPIEAIGIEQVYRALNSADLILYVVDAQFGLTEGDLTILEKCSSTKRLILWNKTDTSESDPPQLDIPVLKCAAIHESGHEKLENALKELFGNLSPSTPVLLNERQRQLAIDADMYISNTLKDLDSGAELDMIAVQLEFAVQKLREIEGGDVSEDVINGVFSRFCVGK